MTRRARIAPGAELAGHSLAELDLEGDPGVRLLALRRETDWIRRPGPDESVDTIVSMKDKAELATGLAYTASLYDEEAIASEVGVLGRRSDELETELEACVLNAAGDLEDPSRLRGLLVLASASEVVSDAALQIAEVVLRDVDTPALYAEALDNAEEIITSITVEEGSELAGRHHRAARDGPADRHGRPRCAARGRLGLRSTCRLRARPGRVVYARGPPSGERRMRERAQG